MLATTCDVHVHFPRPSLSQAARTAEPRSCPSLAMRVVLHALAGPAPVSGADAALAHLAACMERASTRLFIVLALDAPRLEDGREAGGSMYFADNDSVAQFCEGHPRGRFGASIHPYRPDA